MYIKIYTTTTDTTKIYSIFTLIIFVKVLTQPIGDGFPSDEPINETHIYK